MKPARALWTFRLYPEKDRRLFVRAFVFQRRGDMLEFWRLQRCGPGRERRNMLAATGHLAGSTYHDRCVAWVSFWRREMGVGIIAHEFLHAALAYARCRGVHLAEVALPTGVPAVGRPRLNFSTTEEHLAYIHEWLMRDFVNRAECAGLYQRTA